MRIRFWRRFRERSHIRLRISTPLGVITEVDCQDLYFILMYSGTRRGEWFNLLAGETAPLSLRAEFHGGPVKVEARINK